MTSRRRIYEILDLAGRNDRTSLIVDIFIISLITLNILAIILDSVNEIHVRYESWFLWFEVFSIGVFTIEYALRIWSCVEREGNNSERTITSRLRFAITPLAVIDLIVILPFYLGMFFNLDLRFMRVLRLLRIFKLTRYSSAMSMLLSVLRQELRSFFAVFYHANDARSGSQCYLSI